MKIRLFADSVFVTGRQTVTWPGSDPELEDRRIVMYDVVIIGAGVTGAAAARELSKYQSDVCVLEKAEDVCCGTSKANSGIVHAGYDAEPGTMKAKMNVLGNEMMEKLTKDLDIPFQRKGSFVVLNHEEEMDKLVKLYDQGIKNGVKGLRILSGSEAKEMEPKLSEHVCAALYAPSAGIICPFELNIAMAEDAAVNGTEFYFRQEVTEIRKMEDRYLVTAGQKVYETRCIVNAAGVYADVIHNMVCEEKIHITARRGEYCLLDRKAGNHVSRTIFTLPGRLGKGVLVTPTVHGNILLGPTAENTPDKEGTNTTREGLSQVMEKAGLNVKDLPKRQIITSFAGLRAHEDGDDFIIGEADGAEGFFDCAGIESPGLTSSPAIGVTIAELAALKLGLKKKEAFISTRKGILKPERLTQEERNELIRKNPSYGTIICRCEMVTEGEILDAVRRPLGAATLDGIKRRTRAQMGRCQAGFCTPKVMDILARELGIPVSEVEKSGSGSKLIVGSNKEV